MNSTGQFVTRCLCVTLLLAGVCSVSGLSDDGPQVLQPNETAYSAEEAAALVEAIAALEQSLADETFACRMVFSSSGWFTWDSEQFAAYTAGILEGRGYDTRLVRGEGWPDGTHTWVLVAVSIGERMAWVPVEASPEAGAKQLALGHVPQRVDDRGNAWFEEAYVRFAGVVELPANRTPKARVTTKDTTVSTTKWTRVAADGSYDSDGAIVLYVWDFGDGEPPTVTTIKYIQHRFSTSGTYMVTLTVVDDRGAMETATIEITSSIGCGCG